MISAQHEPAQKLLLPLVLKQVFKYTTLKEKKKKKEKNFGLWIGIWTRCVSVVDVKVTKRHLIFMKEEGRSINITSN